VTIHEDSARRSYWTSQLDEAYDFMMRVMKHPVVECGETESIQGMFFGNY